MAKLHMASLYYEPCRRAKLLAGGALYSALHAYNVLTGHGVMLTYKVRAGDALYIPAGWWHEVLTPGCSLALNFWSKPQANSKLSSQP